MSLRGRWAADNIRKSRWWTISINERGQRTIKADDERSGKGGNKLGVLLLLGLLFAPRKCRLHHQLPLDEVRALGRGATMLMAPV